MSAILAGAAAGAAGYGLSKLFGGDEEVEAYNPDAEAFDYGGKDGDFYDRRAGGAQERSAAYPDYAMAEYDRQRSIMAGDAQAEAAAHYRAILRGEGKYSVAQQQLQQGTDRNIASQMALARSGGDANARRTALVQGSIAQQQHAGQSAMLRAQEYQMALKGFSEAATAQRTSELEQMGYSAQMAQYQAMLEQQQRQQNDAYSLGLYGLGQNAEQSKMGGQMALEGMRSGNASAAAQYNADIRNQSADRALQAGAAAFGYGMQYGQGSSSEPKKPGDDD